MGSQIILVWCWLCLQIKISLKLLCILFLKVAGRFPGALCESVCEYAPSHSLYDDSLLLKHVFTAEMIADCRVE